MTGLEGDLTLALQFGALGLALGVWMGHRATNWLWKRRVEQLKLDWTEELFERKPTELTFAEWHDLCECGHIRREHVQGRGSCGAAHASEDSGLCSCAHFIRRK